MSTIIQKLETKPTKAASKVREERISLIMGCLPAWTALRSTSSCHVSVAQNVPFPTFNVLWPTSPTFVPNWPLFKERGDGGGEGKSVSLPGMAVVAEEALLRFERADDDACRSRSRILNRCLSYIPDSPRKEVQQPTFVPFLVDFGYYFQGR